MTRRTYDLTQPPGAPSAPSAGTTTAPGASNRQLKFLSDLAVQREIAEDARKLLLDRIDLQVAYNAAEGDCAPPRDREGLTKTRASDFIERMLKLPQRRLNRDPERKRDIVTDHAPLPGPDRLPAGHYAVKNADGQIRFYRLKRGTKNPNMIWLHVEHGDSDTEIPFHAAKPIILKIAVDPLAAARLYGDQIGACSNCGRRLTNRVSRLLNIGPICGGHLCDEDIWRGMVRRAREALAAAGLDPDADVEDTDDLARIREQARL